MLINREALTKMENFNALAEVRYSVRQFKDQAVEQEKLDLILRAGQVAPTACNYQPQRILVLDREDTLAKLEICTKYRFNAPLALLVCYDKTVSYKRKQDGKDGGEIDASIVTTHMTLAAADIGLGSTWVMSFDPAKIISEYNIPENLVPVDVLVIGYPADNAKPSPLHLDIRAIEETVFYNEF